MSKHLQGPRGYLGPTFSYTMDLLPKKRHQCMHLCLCHLPYDAPFLQASILAA